MADFIQAARSENPDVPITVSGGRGAGTSTMSGIIGTGIDFAAPHFERTDDWADRTDDRVIEYKNYSLK